MNILITGSNGFLGHNLCKLLKLYDHNIYKLSRQDADLLDSQAVNSFFEQNNTVFDLVIHTAVEGGRRNTEDSSGIVYNNLLMVYNLLRNQNYFQCMISFGSGAELDRRYDINPSSINRYPTDPYGLSKNLIDKLTFCENKLCNFRIYNCFGLDEKPDRMIRGNIQRYINHENIIIDQDKRMDFFFVYDLAQLIHFFLDSNNIPKVFDCCYKDKVKLSDIANIINNLDSHKVDIEYKTPPDILGTDYVGQYVETHIPYVGLEKSIELMYVKYKEQYEK